MSFAVCVYNNNYERKGGHDFKQDYSRHRRTQKNGIWEELELEKRRGEMI